MELSLTVENTDVVLQALSRVTPEMISVAKQKFELTAKRTLKDAVAACPYDENNKEPGHVHLRDTGRIEEHDDSSDSFGYDVTFGDDSGGMGYAWYQELGTVKMAAQPYLYPAFTVNAGTLINVLERITPGSASS